MKPTQIRVEMARRGLTGLGMARDLGFSTGAGYINKIARGVMACNTSTAIKIAVKLEVPMTQLFESLHGVHRAKPASTDNGVSGVAD